MNSWFDHCWAVLDSLVILSLGFQLELFVALQCSEGLEWVLSLEISAGFIGWKFGWLEIWKNIVYAMPKPVWILHKQLCCVCGVLGHVAPVHRCARSRFEV